MDEENDPKIYKVSMYTRRFGANLTKKYSHFHTKKISHCKVSLLRWAY